MKSKRNYFIGFFVIFLLASCGNGIQNQSGIKLIPVQSGKDYQYINKKGKIVINPQFSEATMFREGLALVKTTGNEPRWGFISEDGKYAVNAQYIEATVFSDGLAWVVTENSAPTVIDTKGNIKFALSVAEQTRIFRNGLAAYSTVSADGEEKWGFVNKSGQVKINPQFTETDDFNEGICAVRNKDGKWGYIDTDGSLTINYQFDEAQSFKNGKAIVELGGKLGVINKDGKYLINPQFTGLVNDRDIFLVNQNDRWGWCDKDGSITINPQFDFALPFYDNELAPVRSDRNFGYIDKEGKIVINPQFDEAYPFVGDLALVSTSDKYGFIDYKGKYVINPQFDNISTDFSIYISSGSSEFIEVNTDYFNISLITSLINVDSPEGFTFNSTFKDLMGKYNLSESDFSYDGDEIKVVNSSVISQDASYDFYFVGNAFDTIQVKKGSGWYEYMDTEYIFNGNKNPSLYAYNITLTGKGYAKIESVLEAIQGKLSSYKTTGGRNEQVFTDEKKEITLKRDGNEIWVIIKDLTKM